MDKTFQNIIPIILKNESGYANVEGDSGGETYRGIARNYHPTWSGWDMIDEYKELTGKIEHGKIFNNSQLEGMVINFYYNKFYKPLNLFGITDEKKILNIFDFAVNTGKNRAVKYAQKIVDVDQDGVIGKITTKHINEKDDFVDEYKKARIIYYNYLANKYPKKYGKFLNGWIKRVNEL